MPTPARRRGKKSGHHVDAYVGQQIRRFRLAKGMSQTDVADQLDVTFQQVQKYEKGWNRIAPSRLATLSRILDIDISSFFPGELGNGNVPNDPVHELSQTRYGVRLAQAYIRIEDENVLKSIVELVESVADAPSK